MRALSPTGLVCTVNVTVCKLGLHLPNDPALYRSCTSDGNRARLKISTSSTLPKKSLPKPPPIRKRAELERDRERIVGSNVSTCAPSTNSLPPVLLPRETVAATRCHFPSATSAEVPQFVQPELAGLLEQLAEFVELSASWKPRFPLNR